VAEKGPARPALGADLVIPVLAAAFAAYFFVSIAELEWEAKANGVLIGAILVFLVLAQAARTIRRLARGEGGLGFGPLAHPRDMLARRSGLVGLAAIFIVSMPWLGMTLALLLAMFAALWITGVRRPSVLASLSFGVAAAAYLLFIAVLRSEFPHGPIERLLAPLLG
jgi:hypothetical protein